MLFALNESYKVPSECKVLVMGSGGVATGAIKTASQLGCDLKILSRDKLDQIEHYIKDVDVLVNGLSWPKEKRIEKEFLVTKDMLDLMSGGGIILDLAVDEPGPIETCRATDISNPFYIERGIKHICIYGYPGLAPLSSSKVYSIQVYELLLEIIKSLKHGDLNTLPEHIKKATYLC